MGCQSWLQPSHINKCIREGVNNSFHCMQSMCVAFYFFTLVFLPSSLISNKNTWCRLLGMALKKTMVYTMESWRQGFQNYLGWLLDTAIGSKQASSTFFSFNSCHVDGNILTTSIRHNIQTMVKMDDPELYIKLCDARAKLLQCIMPMAFNNFATALHFDTLIYATTRGGGYRLQL